MHYPDEVPNIYQNWWKANSTKPHFQTLRKWQNTSDEH